MKKRVVLLVLCRKVIARLLIESIEKDQNMEAYGVYNFAHAKAAAMTRKPHVALIEIPERYDEPAQDALDVCSEIREVSPDCKIMLLCPERDEKSVEACVASMRQGIISDFLFYESSVEYLASKVKVLCP
jgi:response regulator RpfG family c-di-GMP phosphodiesterase